MVLKFLIFVLIVNFLPDSYEQRDRRFFRKDYTYLEAFESFYKLHTIPLTWSVAKKQCALEGGILWHPENDYEAQVLISFWNSTNPKIKWVYVGLSDLLVEGVFVTVDEKPITEVYSTWEINEPNNAGGEEDCVHMDYHGNLNDVDCDKILPFICKKSLETLQWNSQCNIPNLDYSFSKDTGKCYKLHTTPLTWPEASARCQAEHTSLAVISSHREAFYLEKLTETARKPKIVENFQRGIYHLGFHNRLKEGWQTIKGAQINVEDDLWFENYKPEGRDQCGSMFYTGRLINTDCDMKSFFICEHQPTESTFLPISISSTRAIKPIEPYFGFGAE